MRLEKELKENKEQLESLQTKCHSLEEASDRKISKDVHTSIITDLK